MNWTLKKFLPLFFVVSSAISTPVLGAANLCHSLFEHSIRKVVLSEETHVKATRDLRATISGKLATVYRSEWKTKLSVLESNQYVFDLITSLLSDQSSSAVLQNLDIRSSSFTRQVHERLYNLQVSEKLKNEDELAVRDMPAPTGAKDDTFTYYTKPIVMANREGKHQIRIRTYVREVSYDKIPVGKAVTGFDGNGKQMTITRLDSNAYQLQIGADNLIQSVRTLTTEQIISLLGPTAMFHAPHGKSYKLEVKSALEDQISGQQFPLLAGPHMVQKLDVSLTPKQVAQLGAPLKNKTDAGKRAESYRRIDKLVVELKEKFPESLQRIEADLALVREGVRNDAEFLVIEGATMYNRTAFETKSGLQTTVDREQRVYTENMYTETGLKNPMQAIRENSYSSPKEDAARHVELKVPVTAMQNSVGITYADPAAAMKPQSSENDGKIKAVVQIYYKYVKSKDHPGKFNFIRKNGESEEATTH